MNKRLSVGLVVLTLMATVLGLLSPAVQPVAFADGSPQSGAWYRYQGEPDSYDKYDNQEVNCGPTSVAMAVQYSKGVYVPIRKIRTFIGKNSDPTDAIDLAHALDHWRVKYSMDIYNAGSIKDALARGNIVLVALDMRKIAPGADVNGRSTDPDLRTGRFETQAVLHWIVVKGISSDGKYFVVYDGNVWGEPGNPTYWYSDGTPKGMNRLYDVKQVEQGMFYFGRDSSKGLEILGGKHSLNSDANPPMPVDTAPEAGEVNSSNHASSVKVSIAHDNVTHSRYVTLHIAASKPDVTGMMISNNPYFTEGFEVPYSDQAQWTLSPHDGTYTVYVRVKSSDGKWSQTATDKIDLQARPPVGTLVAAPDPRVISAVSFSDSIVPSIGQLPDMKGEPRYASLGRNLLRNSSFELWSGGTPMDWSTSSHTEDTDAYGPTTVSYDGTQALLSESPDSENSLSQVASVKPNTSYTLTAYAKGDGGVLSVVERHTEASGSQVLRSHKAVSKQDAGWQRLSITFRTGSDTTDASVGLYGQKVSWDAVQLEQGNKADAYQPDGLLLEPPTTNLIANSSVERGPEGWSGLNGWISLSDSHGYSANGDVSLLVHKQKEGPAATFFPAQLTPGQTYTFSMYARLENGQPVDSEAFTGWIYKDAKSTAEVDTSTITDANHPKMTWVEVGGGWYRGSFSFKATFSDGLYGVMSTSKVKVGDVYYLDAAQLEPGSRMTSYTDGGLGKGYKWQGEPYLSTSQRGGISLSPGATEGNRGTLLFHARAYSDPERDGKIMRVGSLRMVTHDGKLNAIFDNQVIGSATWETSAPHAYAVTWDGSRVALYQDGKLVGEVPGAGPAAGSQLVIGSNDQGAEPDAVVGMVSLWRSPLEVAEIEQLVWHPWTGFGLPQVTDQYITVVTCATDTTDASPKVEWSLEGREWHQWSPTCGEHSWNLGASPGPKTVWVRYKDADGNWQIYSASLTLKGKSQG